MRVQRAIALCTLILLVALKLFKRRTKYILSGNYVELILEYE